MNRSDSAPSTRTLRLRRASVALLTAAAVALLAAVGAATAGASEGEHDGHDGRDGEGTELSCTPGESGQITDGGFEAPSIGDSPTFRIFSAAGSGSRWDTTATDGKMEYWVSGYQGVPAFDGKQFAELNANLPSALFQDIATVPGETYNWRLAHRGRAGTDTMALKIGAPGATVQVGQMVDDKFAWTVYEGTYTVPAGQTVTRFEFAAVSTASGSLSIGNFLDGISFTPCALPPLPPTTVPPTTVPPTTVPPTTVPSTTVPPTTEAPTTTVPPTTEAPTTVPPPTEAPDTVAPTTVPAGVPTTEAPAAPGGVASETATNWAAPATASTPASASTPTVSSSSSTPSSLAFTGGDTLVLVVLGTAALILGLLAGSVSRRPERTEH